jgi:SAM-dependent methyltransferase
MRLTDRIMENTQAYRIWQAPFVEDKFAPILAHNDMTRIRRALDIGCGPGTNAHWFEHAEYMGIDWNRSYIEYAQQHHKGTFVVADVTTYTVTDDRRFDFIFVNSFFHHINTPDTQRILSHLGTLLTEDGHVHILDLVLPERRSIAWFLARMDRGEFPRLLNEWWELLSAAFEPLVFEPYTLNACGATLWNMVYFKGRKR